ncbi:DUF4336 domain-containing protein [Labrys neptuniae]
MITHAPYLPLNSLKPAADGIWTVDGPEIGMRSLGMTIPFPTRMTVIRLPPGELWIHSPIAWDDALATAIAALGPVGHLVAPNTLHYWYLPDWQAKFPRARSYGPPGLMAKARRPVTIDEELGDEAPPIWRATIEQCLVPGKILTEVDFFHRPSRTLILTDLIENFEMARIRKPWLRWLIRFGGAADPDGKAPIDMQLNFTGQRDKVREAARRMIEWAPDKIILAHGRCYERDGVEELRRAFRWVL